MLTTAIYTITVIAIINLVTKTLILIILLNNDKNL